MFDKTFCSGAWIHMRINPNGEFGPCRWSDHRNEKFNIKTHSILEYFQHHMAPIRQSMLQGDVLTMCEPCHQMEKHGKVSGRQRQLLKTGIMSENFVATLQSSVFVPVFEHSQDHSGQTYLRPVDWQIDLGNYCNSLCVMCSPKHSSRIANEYQKIGIITDADKWNASWADDDQLVDKFCQELIQGPVQTYLHFLGGETLIQPAFKKILSKLIGAGMCGATIGFTTNLTVWPEDVVELLLQFDQLHIGLSIEALHEINHYVRWPGQQHIILENLQRWITLAKQHGHLVQIRPTPSALTILHVADLYQYAWDQNVGVEPCNFIYNPRCLSLNVLPQDLRAIAIDRFEKFMIDKAVGHSQIVNTRNPSTINQQVAQDAQSYINYLRNSDQDADGAAKLVPFLKKLEQSRGNAILEYLPEYEKFLRSHGY